MDGLVVVAVSKTRPSSDILSLYNPPHSHRDFGENYVQELIVKAAELPSDIRWHFIGTIQSNKIKSLLEKVPFIYAIHSVDSINKANLIEKHATTPIQIYIQVNTSGEKSKGGIDAQDEELIYTLATHVHSNCSKLKFAGLMTIGRPSSPLATTTSSDTCNPDFKRMQELRDYLKERMKLESVGLSMGMSDDYEEAVRMGSTCIRIGSLIFGPRSYPSLNQ